MSKTTIKLNGKITEADAGPTKVEVFYNKLGIKPDEQCLYLDKPDDIDLPLLPDEYIIIHGDEVITAGDVNADIGDNPVVRNPVQFKLNGDKIEKGVEKAKIKSDEIRQMDKELESSRLFVDLEGKVDAFIKDGLCLVVQDTDSYFTIPSNKDDVVDLEDCSKNMRKPPKGQEKYRIKIDQEPHTVDKPEMTGAEIMALAGKDYAERSLNQKLRGGRRKPIEKDDIVDFSQDGIERFETVMRQAQQG